MKQKKTKEWDKGPQPPGTHATGAQKRNWHHLVGASESGEGTRTTRRSQRKEGDDDDCDDDDHRRGFRRGDDPSLEANARW